MYPCEIDEIIECQNLLQIQDKIKQLSVIDLRVIFRQISQILAFVLSIHAVLSHYVVRIILSSHLLFALFGYKTSDVFANLQTVFTTTEIVSY